MTDTTSAASAPTAVLVHGAIADASGWAGVIRRLDGGGRPGGRHRQPAARRQRRPAYVASVTDWVTTAALAFIGVGVILHMAIGLRWPFASAARPPSSEERQH